ncbi:MAG: hypothetical protein Q8N78_05220 [Sulfurimonas sp.]|nr:hypothetical protein [Sulfurimonas sp.]
MSSIKQDTEKIIKHRIIFGKILTYDSSKGVGVYITRNSEKKDFSINEWSDINNVPEIGLQIIITQNNKIYAADVALEKNNKVNVQAKRNDNINTKKSSSLKIFLLSILVLFFFLVFIRTLSRYDEKPYLSKSEIDKQRREQTIKDIRKAVDEMKKKGYD